MASELVVNGTFDTDTTGWTLSGNGNGTAESVSGVARVTIGDGVSGFNNFFQEVPTVVGRTYRIRADLVDKTSTNFKFRVGSTNNGGQHINLSQGTAGSVDEEFTATSSTTFINMDPSGTTEGQWAEFDNISLKIIASAALKRRGGFIASMGRMMGA